MSSPSSSSPNPPPPPPFPAPLGEGSTIFASRGRSFSLFGELPAEEILKIAAREEEEDPSSSGTRWLFLNPAASFPAAAKEGDGSSSSSSKLRLSVAPCVPPLQAAAMDDALSKARELLSRPEGQERGHLVIQCSTAQRAGAVAVAALLLGDGSGEGGGPSSLAPEAALSLARSAPFKFATNPGVLGWLERWAAESNRKRGGGGKGAGAGEEEDEDRLPAPSPLVFRQLFDAASSTYTYLLADADAKEAVLIDPVRECAERDARLVEQLGLELVFAINTHVHADHVTGTGKLKELFSEKRKDKDKGEGEGEGGGGGRRSSSTTAVVPRSAISRTAGAAADVRFEPDKDALVFGRFALRPLATPGHTKGCCSFFLAPEEGEIGDATAAHRRRRARGGLVFTGDALLIRGCGRTDFQGGSSERLFASVRDRLFSLPDDTRVFPAHDYRGMTSSTIGEEKAHNPRLGLARSAAEFAETMRSLDLPKPKMIDEAVPANLRCGV